MRSALFDALSIGGNVEVVEVDTGVNDEAVATKAVELLFARLKQ